MNTQQVYTWLKSGGWRELAQDVYLRESQVSIITSWEEAEVKNFCFDWVYDARGFALVDVYKGMEFKAGLKEFSLKVPVDTEGRTKGKPWRHTRLAGAGYIPCKASGLVRLAVEKAVCNELRKSA